MGFTVTAIASREDEAPAAALAQAVGLDMHAWWTPTAAGYFNHVSKARALEGVHAFAPAEVSRLGKLKKAQIANEAERLAAGTGWLPAMFRAPEVAPADVASVEPIAERQADAENHEDARATT
ncbi:hypothetical protein D3C71_1025840 [compost metagenome]